MGFVGRAVDRPYRTGNHYLSVVVWPVYFERHILKSMSQEIPETQQSTSPLSSISPIPQDLDPIIGDAHTANNFPTTRRKRHNEPQNVTRKKPKVTARQPTTVDNVSLLTTRLQIAQQDLESEKKKVRVLEKEIGTLKELRALLMDRLKARGETVAERDRSIAAGQDAVKILHSRLERKELTMTILENVIKLSKLSFEKEE